jgi:hypothetical protein
MNRYLTNIQWFSTTCRCLRWVVYLTMLILRGRLLLSASDLVNFLGCPHATYLDLRDLTDPVEIPERDAATVLIFEKGIEHEKRHLETLKARGLIVVGVPGEGFDLAERTPLTREVMLAGAEAISSGFGPASLARLCRLSGTGRGSVEPWCLGLRAGRYEAPKEGQARARHPTHELFERSATSRDSLPHECT